MFADFWGAGAGVRAAAGSRGHQIVLDVGHKLGKDFRPWEAVRLANNIGRVSKFVGPAIQTVLAALEVAQQEKVLVDAERRRVRRRQNLIGEVRRQADALAGDLQTHVADALDPSFSISIAEIDAAVGEIHAQQAARTSLSDELTAISAAADEMLAMT